MSAAALAVKVDAIHAELRAAPDPARRAGFRLDDVAGTLRRVAGELEATAAELARVRAAREAGLCKAEWGVCPEHGGSLISSGGQGRCQVCGRVWDYDRLAEPCGEPLTHLVADPTGGQNAMCAGHAVATVDMPGWTARQLGPDEPR